MFDFNKSFTTFANQFNPAQVSKEAKEYSDKLKDFSVTMLETNVKATLSTIEAVNQFAGSESTKYLMQLTEAVDNLTDNAKEIIESIPFKSFAYAGHKK